tara:strand:+ start:887 stop:1795 length:909 start_codon:yes stop_codon:yes gene_type:complete
MANSKLYFTPAGTSYGGLDAIDFGETVSDMQITPYRVVSDGVSIGGRFSRTARRSGMRVRIVLERFTDFRLAEKFYSLQSHLEAGGGFSFAVDSAKQFAAFVESAGPSAGFSLRYDVFTHAPRILAEYGAHGLAADDVLHMESFGSGARREELQCSAYTSAASKIQTKTGAIYDHALPSMVRHRDFFPFLIWPQDQMGSPIITHDHRIAWTVDFTAEVYPAHLLAMYNKQSPDGKSGIPDTEAAPQGSGITLDQLAVGPLSRYAESVYGDSGDGSSSSDSLAEGTGDSDPLTDMVDKLEKYF